MPIVGPGSIQQNDVAPIPTLEKASELEYVTIFNPLTDDFAVRVAQDIPVNMPIDIRSGTGLVQNEGDVVRNYGLNLKNPDFKSRKRVVNDTVIKAGSSINLKGNEAQVAVKQLTDEILQREGKTRLMADPHLRHEVEERIIKYRGSIEELMNSNFQTPQNQINEAIKQSNEVHNEVAFPGLAEPTQGSRIPEPTEANTAINDPGQPKRVGRPKKENSPAN